MECCPVALQRIETNACHLQEHVNVTQLLNISTAEIMLDVVSEDEILGNLRLCTLVDRNLQNMRIIRINAFQMGLDANLVGTFPHGIHTTPIALTDEQHPIKCNLHCALPAKSSWHLVNFTLQKQATHIANKCACDSKNRMVNTYDLQQPPGFCHQCKTKRCGRKLQYVNGHNDLCMQKYKCSNTN